MKRQGWWKKWRNEFKHVKKRDMESGKNHAANRAEGKQTWLSTADRQTQTKRAALFPQFEQRHYSETHDIWAISIYHLLQQIERSLIVLEYIKLQLKSEAGYVACTLLGSNLKRCNVGQLGCLHFHTNWFSENDLKAWNYGALQCFPIGQEGGGAKDLK